MSPLRLVYLALAVWGAVHPLYHSLPWLRAEGWSIDALGAAWRADPFAYAMGWELMIAALALSVWVVAEVSVRRNWLALVVLPVTAAVGVGCALPLYLFLRTRPV
ncbi:DUF2834 domain-containing protein [Oceanicola granulosus]|nr:DUF2834 domain-containing protein [Oceanicola granulosus]